MKILFVGDVVGKPGRNALTDHLSELKKETQADFCIVNGENAAAGRGITEKIADELYRAGADLLSTGNHVWDQKEFRKDIINNRKLVRPLNFPPGNPGRGWVRVEPHGWDVPLTLIQLQGRVFMTPIDCPFQAMDKFFKEHEDEDLGIIVLDFHGEATSEKIAIGWYLDGKVSAIIGTHTHIQTADETLLPKGTAYITDVGMTGPHHSIIGCDVDTILTKFRYAQPVQHVMAKDDVKICAVLINVDPQTRKALSIERIQMKVKN